MVGWIRNHSLLESFGMMVARGKWYLPEPGLLRGTLNLKEISILPAGESHAFFPLPRPATCFVAKESRGEGSARRNFGFLLNEK